MTARPRTATRRPWGITCPGRQRATSNDAISSAAGRADRPGPLSGNISICHPEFGLRVFAGTSHGDVVSAHDFRRHTGNMAGEKKEVVVRKEGERPSTFVV